MIILDTTTKSLEIKLTAVVTTNQLPFVSTYTDITTTTFTPIEADGATNNTGTVTVVSAPSASTQRQIKSISIKNADTTAKTVVVQFNNNSTTREIVRFTLAVDSTLFYLDSEGWYVLDLNGNKLMTSGGSSGAPVDAQYVTLATNTTLTAERVLTAGTNIAFVDGGAGSTLTVSASGYYTVITDTLLSVAAANFDFTSIPQTYKHLQLILSLRTDSAGTEDNLAVRFNNVSSASYYSQGVLTQSTTITGYSSLGATVGYPAGQGNTNSNIAGDGALANFFAAAEILIPDYTIAGHLPRAIGRSATTRDTSILWCSFGSTTLNSAGAVSRITLLPVTGSNFKAGSRAMLIGIG